MKYNGTILVPKYSVYPGYASRRYSLLFELIAQRNNFKVIATSSFKKEKQEGKICIAFKTLQHNDIHQNEQVLLLDDDISIIFYPVDLQHIDEPTLPEYRPLYEKLLNNDFLKMMKNFVDYFNNNRLYLEVRTAGFQCEGVDIKAFTNFNQNIIG